jgi:hypothetical protein
MTATILSLAAAYAAVLAILVGILVARRVRPLWRIGAASLAAGLFVLTYWQVGELRGLPSDGPPPKFFQLHWARVIEPNQILREPGSIFLWLEELDEDNYASGVPRAYQVPYSPDLVKMVQAAMGEIQQGKEIAGMIADEEGSEDTAEQLAEEITRRGGDQSGSAAVGERVVLFDESLLSFTTKPAPVTPTKPQ